MNYYSRHVGDYLRDTSHLSLLEHGIYGRLLDTYYTREAGLPVEQIARLVGARTKEEHAALACVLGEFFVQTDGVWTQARCEAEIAKYQQKAERNREVGKLGGRPKATQCEPTKNPDGFGEEPNPNPPNSQEPIAKKEQETAERSATAPPDFDGLNAEVLNGRAIVALSPRWELPETWGFDAQALGFPTRDVLNEAEKFRQYWTAGKGSGKRRAVKGWRQAWSNWLGKAAERAR